MNRLNIKLGVPQRGYGVAKNIPREFVEQSIRPVDYHRIRLAIIWRVLGKLSQRDLYFFRDPVFPKVELFHFFNSVAFTTTAWVVTFESLLPYFRTSKGNEIRGVKALLQPSCKSIIAMSHHSVTNFQWNIRRLDLMCHWESLVEKIEVIYPPEELRVQRQEKEMLKFVFVAREFYKKGGHIVLRALQGLVDSGFHHWSAILIGDLDSRPDETVLDEVGLRKETTDLIVSLADNVSHHQNMPHNEVLAVMQSSHFLLHPTLQDTYGYVITEAMSCGCVPVTCAIRAIPELVEDGVSGYLIKVIVDLNGNPKRYLSTEMWQEVQSALADILNGLRSDWMTIHENMSRAARQHIVQNHCPKNHLERVMAVYNRALS